MALFCYFIDIYAVYYLLQMYNHIVLSTINLK